MPLLPTVMTESKPPITLAFSGLPPALVAELQDATNAAKTRPFLNAVHVEVLRCTEGLVFRMDKGEGGFSFCRGCENDVETFRNFLHDPIQSLYMPIVYDVKERTDAVVQSILDRYANYGAQHAAKIDWIWYEYEGKQLLIMRIPKEIVQGMMHRFGGVLSTQVRGSCAALRQLPVISKIVPEDAVDEEIMHRAFVTPYTSAKGDGTEYDQCLAIHQAAVREVIEAGPMGVSIGPVGVWTP
jgi:hypothetical protein